MKHPLDIKSEMKAIYAELEQRSHLNQCSGIAQCCQFHITGKTPMLTMGEARYAALGVKASGRKKLPEREDGACPLLDRRGKCMIYAYRPFGCRTHYCRAAGGAYPRKAVVDLIQRLDALDEQLRGDGPRPIQSAIAKALQDM